jgi:H+/gluconate symporter-like permease
MSLSTQILYGGAIASLAVILTKFYSPFSKKNKAKFPENSFLKQEIENEKELEQLREMQ